MGENPKFIAGIVDRSEQTARKTIGGQRVPQPNVGVQQQLHYRAASQSSSLEIGPTMSPMISAVPAIEPNPPERRFDLGGGVTWAIGTPNRVTSTGLRVLRTRSITDTYRRPCD